MESAVHINPETSPKLAERHARARYILPAIHAFLFLSDWAFSSLADHGVAEALTGPLIFIFSAVLLVVDLPFSIVALGVMFGGGRPETVAVTALGVGCTVWWYLLGRALDALIRRTKRAS
jgi:hypothetical protein